MSDYLAHHGILGQKWGVRRFQNEDGTYTEAGKERYGKNVPEGKTRYGRGKNIAKEYRKIRNEEESRMEKADNEKETKLYDDLRRLTNKYGLDGDDGGGGDTRLWSERELHYAKKKFWELNDKIQELSDLRDAKSRDHAKKAIIKKYGEVAISDMKHYQDTKALIVAGSFLSAVGGLTIWSLIRG